MYSSLAGEVFDEKIHCFLQQWWKKTQALKEKAMSMMTNISKK